MAKISLDDIVPDESYKDALKIFQDNNTLLRDFRKSLELMELYPIYKDITYMVSTVKETLEEIDLKLRKNLDEVKR